MRIGSPFKDYYDGVQSGAHDDPLFYIRVTAFYDLNRPRDTKVAKELMELDALLVCQSTLASRWQSPNRVRLSAFSWEWTNRTLTQFRAHPAIAVFCGKEYRFIFIEEQSKEYSRQTHFVYSTESLLPFLEDRSDEFKKEKGTQMTSFLENRSPRVDAIREWAITTNTPCVLRIPRDPLCNAGKSSYIPTHGEIALINPKLSNFKFGKAVPSTQAYQELSMFLGNIAAPDNTPITISDKDRIAQHGFDKMSFRKAPTKR